MNIIIAGDFCPRERVPKLIEDEKFEYVCGEVYNELKKGVDYSIVNLECPIVEHDASPIDKCGPNLSCNKKSIKALKWAGFNCVTLANNHFLDFGEVGANDTIETCKACNIDYVGGGMNLEEASKILYKEIEGQKLAIINCCEHEFSIATESTAGSNPLNVVKQYYAIQEARESADKVIVIIHGGVELFWLPSQRMIETYRFFIDAGADAIINHHQHCYSGYEVYKGKPIFYGLGNFCFDGNSEDYRWTSGYMVKLIYNSNDDKRFEIIPYRQCNNKVGVSLIDGEEKDLFFKRVKEYNECIADDKKRERVYQQWCEQTEGMYRVALNPVYSRYTAWLFNSSLGRRIINKRKLLQIYDYIVNESHIERVKIALQRKMK